MSSDRFAQTRARRALQGLGLELPDTLVRAASTRNEVHVAPRQVVRVNCRPDQRLRREGLLCQALPGESYFPNVLGYSGDTGYDFVVIERKPGRAVSRAWPDMDKTRRRKFISELSRALRLLHSVPTPPVATRMHENPHLLNPAAVSPVVPILMAVDELIGKGDVDRMLLQDIADLVNDHGSALDDYHQRTLIHGDLSFENVMVDVNGLSALLDFEWSRGAPPDLELDVLLRFLRFPEAHVPPDVAATLSSLDFEDVPGWIAEDYPELFAHPRVVERLALYCVAFDMAELVRATSIPSLSNMGPLHPVRRLQNLLEGVSPLREQLDRLSLRT
ncbi:MAG: aminoglycoside phosphotransferase family protein [Acidimicrobiales bacterium]|nr:aminoglycoside phosphotransferase family protein [Acidimicrobiales bacterium]